MCAHRTPVGVSPAGCWPQLGGHSRSGLGSSWRPLESSRTSCQNAVGLQVLQDPAQQPTRAPAGAMRGSGMREGPELTQHLPCPPGSGEHRPVRRRPAAAPPPIPIKAGRWASVQAQHAPRKQGAGFPASRADHWAVQCAWLRGGRLHPHGAPRASAPRVEGGASVVQGAGQRALRHCWWRPAGTAAVGPGPALPSSCAPRRGENTGVQEPLTAPTSINKRRDEQNAVRPCDGRRFS